MAITVFPVDNAPQYTGRHLRQPMSVLTGGGTPSRPLGGFSAIRQGSGTVVTATSTTWAITPHSGQLDLEASAQASVYLYAVEDSSNTGSVTAADASNARVDIVYLTLNDPTESDGSTTPALVPGYTAGQPGTGNPPATPARSMVLATINVPKVGGGSPTVTMVAPEVSAGGRLSVRSQAQRDALTAIEGLQVYRLDTHRVETYNGTVWTPYRFQLAAGAGNDGGFSVSSPPIPNASAPAAFVMDPSGQVHGEGMFGFTTGQGSVTSRNLGPLLPPSMMAQTARGFLPFIVRFHYGSTYTSGLLEIDPYLNQAKISRPDGTPFSWAGMVNGTCDNWISLSDVLFDAS